MQKVTFQIGLKKFLWLKKLKILRRNLLKIEDKIPNHDKYITTQEFNKLTAENFAGRLKSVNLTSKIDVADFVTL